VNLIITWFQPGDHAYNMRMSCFQQLPRAQMPKPKPLKRLSPSIRQHTGMKAGVNEIQGSTRKRDS
jgi:hypothetical protein